jgi:thymidylate synthase
MEQTNTKVSDNIFAAIDANTNLVANNLVANNLVVNLEEQQYLDLIRNILDNGTWEEGRNGRTKSIFGSSMRFSLADGKIPILTTKKTAWKTCLKELLWFIRGETDARLLQDQNVHIWDGNTTREFLDSRGLNTTRDGLIGAGYGFQWRHFNAPYDNQSGSLLNNEIKGIDQLQQIIDQLKDPAQRASRRLVMTAWNPSQLDQMALPPCHIMCQFNVHDGNKLSCAMYQRSNDEACGTSFNIASYSFLTHLLAKHCGLEAYEFVYFKGNCHIYEEHIEGMKTQIERKPFPFPTVSIKEIRENINDYQVDDFVVTGYQHHDPIKFQMVA